MVCLRKDHPLAAKATLQVSDLQDNLTIIYHPQRHPEARVSLLELLGNAGVTLEDYLCASHPTEVQTLAKEGHGIAFIREGTLLEEGLITRRLAGVDWTVDTAVIYGNARHQCFGRTETLIRRWCRSILAIPLQALLRSQISPQVQIASR